MEIEFEQEQSDGHNPIIGSGCLVRLSSDLKAMGCPDKSLNSALAWLASHHELELTYRSTKSAGSIQRVTIVFQMALNNVIHAQREECTPIRLPMRVPLSLKPQ